MAGILESLDPLVDLLSRGVDGRAACATLVGFVERGDATSLPGVFLDRELALVALRYANIIDEGGRITRNARDQLIRLDTVLGLRELGSDRWTAVMTVPDYLRTALKDGPVVETLPTIRRMVASAQRRIILASPFLNQGFGELTANLARFLASGGELLVITRQLLDPESLNAQAVGRLRSACNDQDRLDIVSWEEEGLGLHLKAVIADSRTAYVGSANLTWGGFGDHAELGVLLEGPSVAGVERALDGLALELRRRRRLQAR